MHTFLSPRRSSSHPNLFSTLPTHTRSRLRLRLHLRLLSLSGTMTNHPPLIKPDEEIGALDGFQPMGDGDHGALP